jgi:hypothetical protein
MHNQIHLEQQEQYYNIGITYVLEHNLALSLPGLRFNFQIVLLIHGGLPEQGPIIMSQLTLSQKTALIMHHNSFQIDDC